MNQLNLSADAKLLLAQAATGNGTSAIVSGIIDTAGFDAALFLTTIDTVNANNICKLQSGNQSNLSDAADVANSHTIAIGTGQVFIDIVKPPGRYLTFNIARGTSTPVGEIYAILYNSKEAPINNITGNQTGTFLSSPLNGTA